MKISLFSSPLRQLVIFLFFVGAGQQAQAQEALRFQKEIDEITEKYSNVPKDGELIVFTGSSSIKMWRGLADYFQEHRVINAGFGGSHTSDLLHYVDELIIDYKPQKVFIYEGDNDISSGKSIAQILITMHDLVNTIKKALPDIEILLISAKPSISRWHLKDQYFHLNRHLEEYSQITDDVEYVDIWNIMLDENGNPKGHIFLEDKLHMNKAGYDLWAEVIGKYMD